MKINTMGGQIYTKQDYLTNPLFAGLVTTALTNKNGKISTFSNNSFTVRIVKGSQRRTTVVNVYRKLIAIPLAQVLLHPDTKRITLSRVGEPAATTALAEIIVNNTQYTK